MQMFPLLIGLFFFAIPSAPQSKPDPETFDSLAQRADAARDAERLEEAVPLYKKALALHANWAEGWWSLGTIEYDRNNYPAAARAFRKLVPLAPKDGTPQVMLGLCEFELGQDDAALKHMEAGRNLGVADNPELRLVVLYHEGVLLLRALKFQSAQTVLSGLCQDAIPNDDVLRSLGLAVFRITPKEAPAESTPGAQIILRAGHAACLSAEKKYEPAHQEYAALVSDYPNYPGIHYVYGKFLIESSDVPAAIAEFQQELKNNPGDIHSRLEIAASEYKVDSAAGIPYAEQAIHLNPHIPFAHYLLGLLYLDTDNFAKAIPELEIAEKAFPKDAKLYFALGSAYARAGRKQDAEKAREAYRLLSEASMKEPQPGY